MSCPNWVAAKGMRVLGAPKKGDPRVISGESGAVGAGLVTTLMESDESCGTARTPPSRGEREEHVLLGRSW